MQFSVVLPRALLATAHDELLTLKFNHTKKPGVGLGLAVAVASSDLIANCEYGSCCSAGVLLPPAILHNVCWDI